MADNIYKLTFTMSDGTTQEVEFTAPQGETGPQGEQGPAGQNGVSVTHAWDGTTLEVTSASGTTSANLKGDKGDTGSTGQRGTGLLPVTTAPTAYTTAVNGLTPEYRIALSTVKTQSSATVVLAGDTLRYSYYHYPVIYVDSSYVYCGTRVSIRGATGKAGTDASVTSENIATALGYTPADAETVSQLSAKKTVLYSEQTLTNAQKAQARKNIGAMSSESITNIEPKKVAFEISNSCVVVAIGAIGTSSDHYRTDYIDLSGYDTIEFYGKCANGKYSLAFFDSNKTIMPDVSVVGVGDSLANYTMQIPDGAAYAIGSAYVGSSVDATEETFYVSVSSSESNPIAEAISELKKISLFLRWKESHFLR